MRVTFFYMYRRSLVILAVLLVVVGLLGCDGDSTTSAQYYERLVYVAMGASDAVGVGAFPLTNGYVYKINEGLQQRARDVVLHNLGVSGKRISYIESSELPAALAFQPDIITIWAGPNDIIHGTDVSNFESSLYNILYQLQTQTTALVVIANVPDLTVLPRFLIEPDSDVTVVRINAFNRVIFQQATLFSVPVVDLYSGGYASDWEYVSLDGFHPSNQGHAKIAELFLEIIWQYL